MPGFLMSFLIPGKAGTTCLSTGRSTASLRIVSTAALTMTTPARSLAAVRREPQAQ